MTKKIHATVFIPTYYGEAYLNELLWAVFRQKTDFDFEVLIYDTDSKDATQDIIKKYAKKHDNLRYRVIQKEEFGHGKTRQAAAHDAKGDIVVYLSQDATPAHDRWLHEMVKPFSLNDRIVGVVGKQDPRPKALPLLKSEIKAVFSNLGNDCGTTLYYGDDFVKNQQQYDLVCFYSDVNSAARKSALVGDLPYSDVPYAEDQLFGRDLINAGYIKAYASRGNVLHTNDVSLKDYQYRMFDETMGLKRVGIPVDTPGIRQITKLVVRGTLKDAWRTVQDGEYSLKRKVYWLLLNPLFHIQKWKGIRRAAQTSVDDSATTEKYSLEGLKKR